MNQKINISLPQGIELFIKREDLLHPLISGNKFRKLKYNLLEATLKNSKVLLTFGGAFSNHIVAVAAAGKENGFKTVGIIRGEELFNQIDNNPSLSLAKKLGMEFEFISRTQFRCKEDVDFIKNLTTKYGGNVYVIPEGGTNEYAIKGCEEILSESDNSFDFVCLPVGTGGTISGIINSAQTNQQIIGFSSLKGDFLSDVICNFVSKTNWKLNTDYHFGGYGRVTDDLISFLNQFYQKTNVPLDPVYTGKMMFGVLNLIEKGFFPKNSKILAIHTGGLQGIKGMNQMLSNKKKNLIQYEN